MTLPVNFHTCVCHWTHKNMAYISQLLLHEIWVMNSPYTQWLIKKSILLFMSLQMSKDCCASVAGQLGLCQIFRLGSCLLLMSPPYHLLLRHTFFPLVDQWAQETKSNNLFKTCTQVCYYSIGQSKARTWLYATLVRSSRGWGSGVNTWEQWSKLPQGTDNV